MKAIMMKKVSVTLHQKRMQCPLVRRRLKNSRGKMADYLVEKLYMDALENMWAKKKESEYLKEKNMMIIFLH
jgi:hypothetical protein